MNSQDKVAYVIHPVTPEQKQAFREQGFSIVDARFAPEGACVFEANGTSGDAAQEMPSSSDFTPEAIDGMGKKDVRELLEMHGDTDGGSVGEMRDRLKAIMFISE